jgi:hypothetical protein
MDSGVLALAAVAWADGWNAGTPESGLRFSIDPVRLLELLRGTPVARSLLTDLQRAASAGHCVELIVSADHQMAEIATGSGHYILTQAARNAVLAAVLNRSQWPASMRESSTQRHEADASAEFVPTSQPRPAGILWEVPSAHRLHAPLEALALPWLGPAAQLQVQRDRTDGGSGADAQSEVVSATLHLQLPRLGRFDASIRVCGNAVAVLIDCAGATHAEAQLGVLQQRLQTHGLVSAHVGMAPARSTS